MESIFAANVHKSFGGKQAVEALNLQVQSGEIYGLVGPDGAGKTTTLRLLCGAMRPEPEGQVRIAGLDMVHRPEQARANIGYLPQRFSLYEDLTVMENIRFFAEVRGLPAAQWQPRCLEILEFVNLAGFTNRRAGQLSGGMKQKLGLAAALVHQPLVLLLDEPTTGVDPVTRQDFWQLIIRLVSQQGNHQYSGGHQGTGDHQTTVFISTPYMDEAARCTRVGFMHRGRLVIEGRPADLTNRLQGQILELTGQPLNKLLRLVQTAPGIQDVQMFGDRLHLRVPPGEGEKVMAYLKNWVSAQGCEVFNVRSVPPQLEDVFISLSQEAA